ncbi:hypothetical protein NPA07_01785 [Mycoplasmopsis caviae]|uniref:Uncharacterized protein n=1 Tax=Mycoplasmopsis caviae TaxID=55603 RepID=A0A3P8K8I0_9BACT|nr:hypothetical protein [Mycoplasmopsis caviae]UUD35585.1 hypothetical protein NPA07_01785 [Mycoplasmopsis caviae]VDR41649.1 Uncharacterised protein [Mycoplasmopsis caviae]
MKDKIFLKETLIVQICLNITIMLMCFLGLVHYVIDILNIRANFYIENLASDCVMFVFILLFFILYLFIKTWSQNLYVIKKILRLNSLLNLVNSLILLIFNELILIMLRSGYIEYIIVARTTINIIVLFFSVFVSLIIIKRISKITKLSDCFASLKV